jgi:hypothetical protein
VPANLGPFVPTMSVMKSALAGPVTVPSAEATYPAAGRRGGWFGESVGCCWCC